MLTGKWVFKIERGPNGKIFRWKAHWVVRVESLSRAPWHVEYLLEANDRSMHAISQMEYLNLLLPPRSFLPFSQHHTHSTLPLLLTIQLLLHMRKRRMFTIWQNLSNNDPNRKRVRYDQIKDIQRLKSPMKFPRSWLDLMNCWTWRRWQHQSQLFSLSKYISRAFTGLHQHE